MSLKKTAAELREYVKVAQAAYPYQMPAWENPAVESGTADIATVTPQMQRGYDAYSALQNRINQFKQRWPDILKHSGFRPEDVNLGTSMVGSNSYAANLPRDAADRSKIVYPGGILDEWFFRPAARVTWPWLMSPRAMSNDGFNPTNFQSWISSKPAVAISFGNYGGNRIFGNNAEQVAFHELAHLSPQGRSMVENWFGSYASPLGKVVEEARANALGAWNYTKANPLAIFKPNNYAPFAESMQSYLQASPLWELWRKRDDATERLQNNLSDMVNKRYSISVPTWEMIKENLSLLSPMNPEGVWAHRKYYSPFRIQQLLNPGVASEDLNSDPGLTLPKALDMVGNPLKYLSGVVDAETVAETAARVGKHMKTLGLSFKDINPANYLSKNPR